MNALQSFVVFAACIVLCTSAPAPAAPASKVLPVLKDQPAEVLFKADNYSTVLLECVTENEDKDVKYSWHKNGAPFDWKAAGHIGQRPGEGSIMFFNPQPSDEAIYQCFAKTTVGTASTRPISLKRAFLNTPKVETKDHTPVHGRPYQLDCPIPESYPKPTIVWKTVLRSDPKVSDTILSYTKTISPDGTLWFSNVTESDISPSFKYVCVATSPAVKGEVILAEHFLKELIQDKEPNNGELVPQYLSNDMIAKAGDITMIYCIYGGTPLAYPDWYKEGNPRKNVNGKPGDRITHRNRTGGKRLWITETRLEDEGTYTCEAYNEVGKKQTHSMKLSVVSAPSFSQDYKKQLDVTDGSNLVIDCQATGVPEPKVTWTYNGKVLGDKKANMEFSNIKKADGGYYGCKAENEHGTIYRETLVNVV